MSIPTALHVSFSFLLSPINFHRCSLLFPMTLFFPLAVHGWFFCQFCTHFTFRGVPLIPCLLFSSFCLPFSSSSRCIFSRIPPVKASLHPSDSHFGWLPSSLPTHAATLSRSASADALTGSLVFTLQPALARLCAARLYFSLTQ